MRPVLGLGSNTVARPPGTPPLLQSHTKNCSTPAEQGRATASHREGVDCGEVWNLLDASHSLPPSRSFEGPLCSPAGLTKLGQGHGLPSVVPCASALDAALRCIFGGAASGRAPCGLGTLCCLQETKRCKADRKSVV